MLMQFCQFELFVIECAELCVLEAFTCPGIVLATAEEEYPSFVAGQIESL